MLKNIKYKEYIILNIIIILMFSIDICVIKVHLEESLTLTKLIFGEKNGYFNEFDYLKDPGCWGYIIQSLYTISPYIPWFPILMLCLSIVSIAIILNTLLAEIIRAEAPKKIYIPLFLFLFILLNQNLIWISHTRSAFLMCGAAVLLNIYLYKNRTAIRYISIYYFHTALLFTGGMLLRPEAAIGTMAILVPGVLIFFGKNISASVKTLGIYLFCMLALGCYYIYQVSYSNSFYYRLEPDVEYEIMDRGNVVPLSEMKSLKDSMRYESIIGFWNFGDVNQTSPEFVRSLIKKTSDFKHRLFFFAYPHNDLRKSAWKENFAPFIALDLCILIFCFIIIFLSISMHGVRFGVASAMYVLISLALILLTFGINRYARVVEPLSGLLCCFSMLTFYLSRHPQSMVYRWHIILPMFLFVIVYAFLSFSETYSKSQKSTHTEIQTENAVDSLMYSTDRKYVYMTPPFSTFNTPAFHPFYEFPGNKQLIVTEFAQYSGHEPFLKRLSEITQCQEMDYMCRFVFLKEHEKDLIIISDEKRIQFLDKYLIKMYGFDLGFSKLPSKQLYDDVRVWLP